MMIKRNASTSSAEWEWKSIAQAAEHLGVSTRTFQRYIRAGKLDTQRNEKRRVLVRVSLTDRKAASHPTQVELSALELKIDHLIKLVEKSISLYEPRTLDEMRKKWV